jgi:hypothetical protein
MAAPAAAPAISVAERMAYIAWQEDALDAYVTELPGVTPNGVERHTAGDVGDAPTIDLPVGYLERRMSTAGDGTCDGVFALRELKKGTVVCTYPGVLMTRGEHETMHRRLHVPTAVTLVVPTPTGEKTALSLVGRPKALGPSMMSPHGTAFTANCRFVTDEDSADVVVGSAADGTPTRVGHGAAYIETTRDVAPGEELFIDYGKSFFQKAAAETPFCERCFGRSVAETIVSDEYDTEDDDDDEAVPAALRDLAIAADTAEFKRLFGELHVCGGGADGACKRALHDECGADGAGADWRCTEHAPAWRVWVDRVLMPTLVFELASKPSQNLFAIYTMSENARAHGVTAYTTTEAPRHTGATLIGRRVAEASGRVAFTFLRAGARAGGSVAALTFLDDAAVQK